ncbi:hypothetical protein [Nocardia abscessus]|uniref:hypothetical protein n=1 Tax=Nocardia abscessus TaxID=120957 RepID=UPI0024537B46|nr:hypothetical protein [Nocardia abscessus]
MKRPDMTFDRPYGILAVHRPNRQAVVAGWIGPPPPTSPPTPPRAPPPQTPLPGAGPPPKLLGPRRRRLTTHPVATYEHTGLNRGAALLR